MASPHLATQLLSTSTAVVSSPPPATWDEQCWEARCFPRHVGCASPSPDGYEVTCAAGSARSPTACKSSPARKAPWFARVSGAAGVEGTRSELLWPREQVFRAPGHHCNAAGPDPSSTGLPTATLRSPHKALSPQAWVLGGFGYHKPLLAGCAGLRRARLRHPEAPRGSHGRGEEPQDSLCSGSRRSCAGPAAEAVQSWQHTVLRGTSCCGAGELPGIAGDYQFALLSRKKQSGEAMGERR